MPLSIIVDGAVNGTRLSMPAGCGAMLIVAAFMLLTAPDGALSQWFAVLRGRASKATTSVSRVLQQALGSVRQRSGGNKRKIEI